MLKFYNYDIVFAEIPEEVTLAVNITNCPNRCEGCHSPWLRKDIGDALDEASIAVLMKQYESTITCFCLMGGDGDPREVERLAAHVRTAYPKIRTAWYSGKPELPETLDITAFDYIKVGPYIEQCGSLKSPTTNQRLYKILRDGTKEDITHKFWKK
jgi:anaerobic ribonucleoside-triphosphate reductase activating protein